MLPGKYDLQLYRGDSRDIRFVLWTDEEKTEPLDLTGATAEAEIRDKSAGSVIVVLQCTIVAPNFVDLHVSPTMSKSAPAKGVWDLQVTYPNGAVRTHTAGAVKVTGDVTDSS